MLSNKYIKNKTIKIWGATYIHFTTLAWNSFIFGDIYGEIGGKASPYVVLEKWENPKIYIPKKEKENNSHIFSCFRNFCLPFIQKSKEKNLSHVKCIGNKKISCLCCRRVIVGESIDAVPCIVGRKIYISYHLYIYIYIYIYIYFLSFTFLYECFQW
jgi:hypothetical protein